jgi:hypothetical protein
MHYTFHFSLRTVLSATTNVSSETQPEGYFSAPEGHRKCLSLVHGRYQLVQLLYGNTNAAVLVLVTSTAFVLCTTSKEFPVASCQAFVVGLVGMAGDAHKKHSSQSKTTRTTRMALRVSGCRVRTRARTVSTAVVVCHSHCIACCWMTSLMRRATHMHLPNTTAPVCIQ